MAEWTNNLVGKMHGKIKKKELAEHLGYTPEYVSEVLNGKREPKNAQEKFEKAVEEMLNNENTT